MLVCKKIHFNKTSAPVVATNKAGRLTKQADRLTKQAGWQSRQAGKAGRLTKQAGWQGRQAEKAGFDVPFLTGNTFEEATNLSCIDNKTGSMHY